MRAICDRLAGGRAVYRSLPKADRQYIMTRAKAEYDRPDTLDLTPVANKQPARVAMSEAEAEHQFDQEVRRAELQDTRIAYESDYVSVRSKTGYVYILTNSMAPGWIKIGKSAEPEKRLRGYAGNHPGEYAMPFDAFSVDCAALERAVRTELVSYGHATHYEWIKCSTQEAFYTLMRLLASES